MQKPARSKGEPHTYFRSVFPQSHYITKYILTCLAGFNRLYDVISSKMNDYISHNTEYGHYESQNVSQTDVFYELRVYPSAQKAEVALQQEKSQGENSQDKHINLEDRLNKSGQNIGKMLVVKPVRNDKGGQCKVIYTQDSYFVYIRGETSSCETAKKFQQELSF